MIYFWLMSSKLKIFFFILLYLTSLASLLFLSRNRVSILGEANTPPYVKIAAKSCNQEGSQFKVSITVTWDNGSYSQAKIDAVQSSRFWQKRKTYVHEALVGPGAHSLFAGLYDYPSRNALASVQDSIVCGICPVTDTTLKTKVPAPKPGYLQSYIDPLFGTKITRISGDVGTIIPNVGGEWGSVVKHHYQLDQPWNADQSLLALFKPRIFLDGRTYQPVVAFPNPGEGRWHPTDPNLIIYISGNELGLWNVRAGSKQILNTFSGYSNLKLGPNRGNLSNDGSKLAFLTENPNNNTELITFAYDWQRGVKYPDINLKEYPEEDLYVTISASGNYIVVRYGSDNRQVFDLNGNKIGPAWSEYGRPSHCDLTLDENGDDDVAVGASKSDPDRRKLIKRRLRDGLVTVVGVAAAHTSARNLNRPGWVYTSGPKGKIYKDEVLAIRLSDGLTERWGYVPNTWSDYEAELHAVPSPDGKRIIFASNWGEPANPATGISRPVSVYVIEGCSP